MRRSILKNNAMVGLIMISGLLAFIAGCQQSTMTDATYAVSGTPRLVELGTAACIPCALTRPGLDQLKTEYAGQIDVEIIDTLFHPDAKTQYNAPFCATQIYIAASGKELYRHVGYASKEDIIAKWKELGVDLKERTPRQG